MGIVCNTVSKITPSYFILFLRSLKTAGSWQYICRILLYFHNEQGLNFKSIRATQNLGNGITIFIFIDNKSKILRHPSEHLVGRWAFNGRVNPSPISSDFTFLPNVITDYRYWVNSEFSEEETSVLCNNIKGLCLNLGGIHFQLSKIVGLSWRNQD